MATRTLELPITPVVPLMMYPPSLVCWTPKAAANGAEPNCRCHYSAPVELSLIVPAPRFPDYLAVICGLIRRYGASEPTVAHALLRLLGNCAAMAGDDPERRAAIEEQARIIVSDAEREVAQPADLTLTHAEAQSVFQALVAQSGAQPHGGQPNEPPPQTSAR